MSLKKAPRQSSIPAVLTSAYVWRGDWQFGGQGDSALVMLHALARRYYTCGAKHCPGNQVVKIRKPASLLRIVKPDGTQLIYRLKGKVNRFAPEDLTQEQIARHRSDLGPTTVTVTACNPETWWRKPHQYRDRVIAVFVFVRAIPAE